MEKMTGISVSFFFADHSLFFSFFFYKVTNYKLILFHFHYYKKSFIDIKLMFVLFFDNLTLEFKKLFAFVCGQFAWQFE